MSRMPYNVTGRGLKRARVSITFTLMSCTIRIEDDEDPEFQLQLEMERHEVYALLMNMNNALGRLDVDLYRLTGDLGDLPPLPLDGPEVPRG